MTYQVPTYRFDGARVFTNKPPCGPKRGHGTPQPRFALEVQLDKIACDLGLDPAEIRRRHLHAGELADRELPARRLDRPRRLHRQGRRRPRAGRSGAGSFRPGGASASPARSYICGAGLPIYWNTMPQSGVQLKLDRGGGVTVFCGSTDIGQGSDSILAYDRRGGPGHRPLRHPRRHRRHGPDAGGPRLVLLARDADDRQRRDPGRRAREGDAGRDGGARSSRSRRSARGLRRGARLRRRRTPSRGMTLRRGGRPRRVEVRHARDRRLVLAAAVGRPLPRRGRRPVAGVLVLGRGRRGRRRSGDRDPARSRRSGSRTTSASASIRLLVMGQVEGSVYMGLGEAMMEEMAYRTDATRTSSTSSRRMLEYKSPTTKEMPEVVTYLVEDPDPNGPFGAKEVGQGPLLPIPPAVANAVYDAVGVRVDEVPVTPEKVLRGAQGEGAGAGPRASARRGFPRFRTRRRSTCPRRPRAATARRSTRPSRPPEECGEATSRTVPR